MTVYPRVFPNLTWGQRLSYAVRSTKYWIGPLVSLHLLATIVVLIVSDAQTRDLFHTYLHYLAPVAVADVLIRYVALKLWSPPGTHSTSLLRAITLVYSTWPTYTIAWLMALVRVPLRFQATPKKASGNLSPLWLLPQMAALLALSLGLWYTVVVERHPPSVLLAFAVAQLVLQLRMFAVWLGRENKVAGYVIQRMAREPKTKVANG